MPIEITAEQHKAIVSSPEALEKFANDLVAKAEQEFWKKADNIVCIMIQERIPFLTAIQAHMDAHPELRPFDFSGACWVCKAKNPNRPTAEIIAEAEELVKQNNG